MVLVELIYFSQTPQYIMVFVSCSIYIYTNRIKLDNIFTNKTFQK